MTAATHVVVALASISIYESYFGGNASLLSLPVIVLGSLAPDIDNSGAIVRWRRWIKPFVGNLLADAIERALLGVSEVVRSIFGHRGFLHTPVFCSLLFAAGAVTGWEWVTHFAWGYATHLAADMCTVAGIPLLGPFRRERVSLLPIRTGSAGELVAVCAVLALLAIRSFGSVLL